MIDFGTPPPRRWIDSSLGDPVNMVRVGDVLRMMSSQEPDDNLALQILADAPAHCYGAHSTNGRTHALWALMQLGRNSELPDQLAPLNSLAPKLLVLRIPPPFPTEFLFMAAYAHMRLGRTNDARMALVLADRRRLSLPQREDLYALVDSIPSRKDEPSTLHH